MQSAAQQQGRSQGRGGGQGEGQGGVFAPQLSSKPCLKKSQGEKFERGGGGGREASVKQRQILATQSVTVYVHVYHAFAKIRFQLGH